MRGSEKNRILITCMGVALLFTGFSARLVYLHITKHEEFARLAAEKHSMRLTIHSQRGMIYDRNGELLATNLPVRTVVADATRVTKPEQLANLASSYLKIPSKEILSKLTSGRKYVVIKREVPEETAMDLTKAMEKDRLRGLYFETDSTRIYPNGEILGHVLGFTQEGKGIQGIEMTMNSQLQGKDGYRYTERDRTGKEILLYRGNEKEPENGKNIHLTIDMNLQTIVEEEIEKTYRELKPENVTAIMLDPKTGEVLAMANRPCFNPNDPGKAEPEQMKNRAIIDMVEPGSTFKIVAAAAALNEGTVNENTSIFCENGRFSYGGKILRDHHGYAQMTVHDILVKSSNIGSAKLAMMMGGEKYYEYVKKFGFGQRHGIELPGEIAGLVHPPSRWDKLTITRMPMGQSVAVTPLQITVGMSVIANGGNLLSPHIVKSIEHPDGSSFKTKEPQVVREVVPEKTARYVAEALIGVTQEGGTATAARVNGFQVAGKTGTAQKVSPHGGYASGRYVVSFVGFMPAEDPRFVCLVMVNDAPLPSSLNYGGLVAAPIFSRIADKAARYLDLTPTLPPVPLQTPLAQSNIKPGQVH